MKAISRGLLKENGTKKPRTRGTKDSTKTSVLGKHGGENRVPALKQKTTNQSEGITNKLKRPAENSPKDAPVKKQRSAFGDITNVKKTEKLTPHEDQDRNQSNKTHKDFDSADDPSNGAIHGQIQQGKAKQKQKNPPKSTKQTVASLNKKNKEVTKVTKEVTEVKEINDLLAIDNHKDQKEVSDDSLEILLSEDLFKVNNDSITLTSSPGTSSIFSSQGSKATSTEKSTQDDEESPLVSPDEKAVINEVPEGVREVDKDSDPVNVSEYAESIFRNMRAREKLFPIRKYLEGNTDVTPQMRAILIDWLVEVQENFELYHETLYLAVKIVDLFLQSSKIRRDLLQLVGATAMLISSKIEERHPPPLDDFAFICDDAYTHDQFVKMEMDILLALNFELGIPVPYRFLRRYSRVAGASMETLTLARYILELSLQEYEFVECRPSVIAAACLNLAFKMKKAGEWDLTLVYHSGCREHELIDLMRRLNKIISQPQKKLTTIRMKYSHPVFHEVAKISPLTDF